MPTLRHSPQFFTLHAYADTFTPLRRYDTIHGFAFFYAVITPLMDITPRYIILRSPSAAIRCCQIWPLIIAADIFFRTSTLCARAIILRIILRLSPHVYAV